MEGLKTLAQYAGPVALAAFSGTFLGGVVLSFFWKNFGPWKLLEACKKQCEDCAREREEDAKERDVDRVKMADLNARYEILLEAVQKRGLGLALVHHIKET